MNHYIKPVISAHPVVQIQDKIGPIQTQYSDQNSITLYYQHISSQDVSMISNLEASKLNDSYITFNDKSGDYA